MNGINAQVDEGSIKSPFCQSDKDELLDAIHSIGEAVGERLESFEIKAKTERNLMKNDILTEITKLRTRVELLETHREEVNTRIETVGEALKNFDTKVETLENELENFKNRSISRWTMKI